MVCYIRRFRIRRTIVTPASNLRLVITVTKRVHIDGLVNRLD